MPYVTVGKENSAPIEACGPRTHELIPGSEYAAVEGAGHGLCWTPADEVSAELLRFFK